MDIDFKSKPIITANKCKFSLHGDKKHNMNSDHTIVLTREDFVKVECLAILDVLCTSKVN